MGVMFDMPPALPGGWEYDCGPDKVPGWLNEEGLPTGCVDNNPNPGEPEPTPEPTVTMPVEPPVEVTPEPEPDIYPSPLPLEPLPEAPPVTTEGQVLHPPQAHTRDTLPETGPDLAGWVVAGVLLIAVGIFVALNEWRTK